MSTFYIIVIATVILGFALILIQISWHLRNLWEIHLDLCRIYEVLDRFYGFETGPYKKQVIEMLKANPTKKREYWRDENGRNHWRKHE